MRARTTVIPAAACIWALAAPNAAAQSAVTADLRAAERACRALENLDLPQTSIVATLRRAGRFDVPAGPGTPATTPELPAFCRVRGVVDPAVQFEVWLPMPNAWNGRFEAVGGGGFAGILSYGAMVPAVTAGYVTASTDTGHESHDLEWLYDRGQLIDYGYRAVHEMTVRAKALIAAFYRKGPDYSYFNGCSTGGRQGLMEAQRFPEDYDGIVSGAPVNYFVATHYTQLWVSLAAKPESDESILTRQDLELVNRQVIAQCDAIDGVVDGVLEDPRVCEFEPGVLQCSAHSAAPCLSPEQVGALRKIYEGPKHPRTGAVLHPSLVPGGETGWSLVTDEGLAVFPKEYLGRSVMGRSPWDWRAFDFERDAVLAAERTGAILDATDPDLTAFRAAGGKLIVYHGWNDQVIFPESSIAYYEAVAKELAPGRGADGIDDFMRLYMVPGMMHCRGGAGTDQFDLQALIERWVEGGEAPDRVEARRVVDGNVTRTRPLCPYPETAHYDGSGSTDDAANFVCRE